MPVANKIKSWSFSRYSTYKLCPAKAKYLYIDKLKEPKSEAMDRGAVIHNMAEDYIKGKIRTMPKELKSFADLFKELRAQYKKKINGMVVEDNWSFTKDWDITRWDDWVNCWLRIKLDCAHSNHDHTVLLIKDWKTGKFREELNEEYMEQLTLYALGAFLTMPHIQTVVPSLVYLDQGAVYPDNDNLIFTRADLPKLKKLWEKRVKPMLNDTRFAPRPNDKCRWCHFSKSKGGPCKF